MRNDFDFARAVPDLLQADPDSRTLRRWFKRLDRLADVEGECDANTQDAAYQARIVLMRAMSNRLPVFSVQLSRVQFLIDTINHEHVARIRASKDYGDPIVLVEETNGMFDVADGRHRAHAAMLDGLQALRAVRALPRPRGDPCPELLDLLRYRRIKSRIGTLCPPYGTAEPGRGGAFRGCARLTLAWTAGASPAERKV